MTLRELFFQEFEITTQDKCALVALIIFYGFIGMICLVMA